MLTRQRVCLRTHGYKQFLTGFEALEYIKTGAEIPEVWKRNKTPIVDIATPDIEGYPLIDVPESLIGNTEAFIDFCHSHEFECGEYRTGKVFDTKDERCFLCEIASHRGFSSLDKYNQFVDDLVDCIIYESQNFYVVPEKGPLGKQGFVMIVSKQHYLSAAQFPEELRQEYYEVRKDVEEILRKAFNGRVVAFWEHGSNPTGLSSHQRAVVHFHEHVLVDWRMKSEYQEMLQMVPCTDISAAKNVSYLSYQEGTDGVLMISMDPRTYRPRQAPRQMIALELGLPDGYYNWRWYAFEETTDATLFHLHKALSQWPNGRIRERTRAFVEGFSKRPKKKEY